MYFVRASHNEESDDVGPPQVLMHTHLGVRGFGAVLRANLVILSRGGGSNDVFEAVSFCSRCLKEDRER